MKITLDLPDWVEGKHLYILGGMELAAYKYLEQEWQVNISRCNKCGECCRNFKDDHEGFPPVTEGVCDYLIDNECSLAIYRPFACCISRGELPYCSVEFED